jgi:hypothetical protein
MVDLVEKFLTGIDVAKGNILGVLHHTFINHGKKVLEFSV